ncbi:WD40 repeat domain-containing protein [Mesorhizobium sp. YM1C-6-2]|uniref:WD40 repeat domain-containing protein n=1 Tax=Mesorhizobium sp. YM1C-6-2 TaxID=1827501 RepID=UPI000EF21EF9|nr:WD40 repeat domain-containing protein [Mesorhizobium sp. YM1C-6-2]RLP24202.1 WD40 repeat domain-containing protein [Mesorhizobium sp. YM1C-6-2]
MTEPLSEARREQEQPEARTASETPEASPSQPAEAADEPVRETASEATLEATSQRPEDKATTGNTTPEAAVRPRQQPARQAAGRAGAARTPWLPPALATLLPRLALPAALLAIPIVAALVLQIWLGRTHVAYDESLRLTDGSMDEVTVLHWSPVDGALYAGTRSGSAKRISTDGTVDEILSPGDIGLTDTDGANPVQTFDFLQDEAPIAVYQDRRNPGANGLLVAYGATRLVPGRLSAEGGLFAAVEANNGSAVVGQTVGVNSQAAENGGGAGLRVSDLVAATRSTSLNIDLTTANQAAPQQQQQRQQAQQQQIQQPTDEQTKGENAPLEPPPAYPATSGAPPRYGLSLFRDLKQTTGTLVGEIYGVEDVRALAALPGTDTVIAGDGGGNVFAIDASQQISGASPETYIRNIGRHRAAIAEIVVAAQPRDGGVLFATRAEDRTIKVWRYSVSQANQLISLGDYSTVDVTTPGSTWVRERAANDGGTWASLFSMSSDGSRILGQDANGIRLLALDPSGAFAWRSAVAYGGSAALLPDGKSFVAFNAERQVVELVTVGSSEAVSAPPNLAVAASFTSLPLPIVSFAFDRAGRRFVAVSGDGTISIQDVATPDQAITLSQYRDTGIEAAISPDGSLVAVAETSGQIVIHSAEDGGELTLLDGPQNLGRLAFDGSGKRLRASTTDTLRIHTYSLRNARSTTYDSGSRADAGREGFLPNGDRFLRRDGEAGYRIIDIDSGAEVGALEAAANATGWVSSLDGSRIATLGGRGNISLFREEESPTANGPMPAMADNALRLSADGRALVVGGRGGELYLARLDGDAGEAGYRLRRLALPAPALQYEISPDGASIVTAAADGTVSINDLTTLSASLSGGQADQPEPVTTTGPTVAETVEISGHGAPLTAMALSPDGERLATASIDGRLRVTSIAWTKFMHGFPFAALPSGPERTKLEPQPLDDSPYALMVEQGARGGISNPTFRHLIVYNARTSLGEALDARDRAADAGFPDGRIYRRQGFFRGVFEFDTEEARNVALPRVQAAFPGAYARDLRTWCTYPVLQRNFFDCENPDAVGAEPPPAMAN